MVQVGWRRVFFLEMNEERKEKDLDFFFNAQKRGKIDYSTVFFFLKIKFIRKKKPDGSFFAFALSTTNGRPKKKHKHKHERKKQRRGFE